jgi:hypothetical protein
MNVLTKAVKKKGAWCHGSQDKKVPGERERHQVLKCLREGENRELTTEFSTWMSLEA